MLLYSQNNNIKQKMNNNINSMSSLRAGMRLGILVVLLSAATMASSRPSFPSDEVFYAQTQEDIVNVQMTTEEEKTIR
jgi:hypothetical protein